MPEPLNRETLAGSVEYPMEHGLKKFQITEEFSRLLGGSVETALNCAFLQGWKAALEWLPFRIQQFREIEESLRKEIEDLQSQITTS